MGPGALSHFRIIDLTYDIAGPYCTKLMAGFGAEVIKIEPPQKGDEMRSMGPFYENKSGIERSIPFLWLNTGKKSVTLNLKTEKAIAIFKELVRDADVVIENFPPRFMSMLGLSYEKLREINPMIVMTSISNFGQTGPYRDYKAEAIETYAMSGLMYETGDPDRAPLNSGPSLPYLFAGASAYVSTLIALFHRELTGQGQYIDVSVQESAMNNIEVSLVESLQIGKVRKRKNDRHQMVPWELYECADGEVALVGGPIRHWLRASKIFDIPELFDRKFYHCVDRINFRKEFENILKPCVKKYKKNDLFHAGQLQKLAFGFLASLEDVIEFPQYQHRKFFVEINHPAVGKHKYCGAPFKMTKTPWLSSRSPLLGEHNEAIYRRILGFSVKKIQQLQKERVI